MLRSPRSVSLIAIYVALFTLKIEPLFLRVNALPKWRLILTELLHFEVSRVYIDNLITLSLSLLMAFYLKHGLESLHLQRDNQRPKAYKAFHYQGYVRTPCLKKTSA